MLQEKDGSMSDTISRAKECMSDDLLRELVNNREKCVALGVDVMLDHVSTRRLGDMAEELLGARELTRKLDAGVDRVVAALGFAPGGADFDAMVSAIGATAEAIVGMRNRLREHDDRVAPAAELLREVGGDAYNVRRRAARKREMLDKAVERERASGTSRPVTRLIYMIDVLGLDTLLAEIEKK